MYTKDNMDFPVPKQLITNETETIAGKKILDKNKEQPFYPDLIYRPPPRPPDNLRLSCPETESDTRPKIDIEFQENSPHQEGIISEVYQRPDKSYFQEPNRFRKFDKHSKFSSKIFAKTSRYR